MHDIATIKAKLKELLFAREDIVAAWEGGSAATGFYDDYSDLDLSIIVAGRETNEVFTLLEKHFEELYGIERQYRVPEPAWHGMSQCFYLLKDCQPCFYCDIAVVPQSRSDKFTAPDRHGNAVIWFDKDSIFTAVPTPEEERIKLVQRVLKSAISVDFLMTIELQKALLRRNWIASQMNWQMFLNRCLVPLMNVRYRPAKADFGIRYTDREYPPEAVRILEDLLRYGSVDDIAENSKKALTLYDELKLELSKKYL